MHDLTRHELTRRDPPRPTCAEAAATLEELPVGHYQLADGRAFYGLNEFELRAFCREGWRLQRIADIRLELKLDAQRPPTPATPRPAKPVLQTGEQLAWAI